VHVEAVTSIVGRADSLCGLLYFLALLTYTSAVRAATSNANAVVTTALTGRIVHFCLHVLVMLSLAGYRLLGV
jgi:hypothetical protein